MGVAFASQFFRASIWVMATFIQLVKLSSKIYK